MAENRAEMVMAGLPLPCLCLLGSTQPGREVNAILPRLESVRNLFK